MKLAVLSTSRIVAEFLQNLGDMPELEISALCCRPQSRPKAEQWAQQYGIPAVYTDEEELLRAGGFDAVYIGTANHLHYAAAKRVLSAGYSVILEKPFTPTAAETRELFALADEKQVFLLEAITTPYLPAYRRSRQIGRLFQDPMRGTAPHMTIEENLALAYLRTAKHQRAFFSRVSRADKEFFREQLSRLDMGLEDRMRQPVGLLSGGQRQALTLLMCPMVPPKLLLLDEHTAALDPATAEKVLALTREIVEEHHITTLMITHNMKNALELGTRTFMMDGGRIVLDIQGQERQGLTVEDLLERFRAGAGKELDNDRILLSDD